MIHKTKRRPRVTDGVSVDDRFDWLIDADLTSPISTEILAR